MTRPFVDTSAWYAYFNAADPDHEAVADVLEEERWHLLTSTYVFDEVVTLALSRRGHATAREVGRALRDPRTTGLEPVTAHDRDAAWELFQERPDKACSFTDCTSFVLMDRLEVDAAASTDPDFGREGYEALPT